MSRAGAAVEVTREQVLAYRVAVQGLHREASSASALGVLDLGVQEAMGHPAAVILAARLAEPAAATPPIGPGHRLALAWTLRGAPHVHRRADLDRVARALWPLSEADAAMRLNETGPSVARQGIAALEQFRLATEAMRAAVRRPTAKGAVSTDVSRRLPAPLLRDCRPCGTSHISDSAMRASSLAAGLELEPGTSPPVLLPRADAVLPDGPDPAATATLARAYLTHLGPATDADVAGFLGARRADVRDTLPAGLVPVSVDGRPTVLPDDQLDALREARAPDPVRLLGPFDPYLQARDRALLVPDRSRHKTLWPVLGRPGAVLVDGEIAGVWRTRASGRRLAVTVTPFGRLAPAVRGALADEAGRVASVRGCADVELVIDSQV